MGPPLANPTTDTTGNRRNIAGVDPQRDHRRVTLRGVRSRHAATVDVCCKKQRAHAVIDPRLCRHGSRRAGAPCTKSRRHRTDRGWWSIGWLPADGIGPGRHPLVACYRRKKDISWQSKGLGAPVAERWRSERGGGRPATGTLPAVLAGRNMLRRNKNGRPKDKGRPKWRGGDLPSPTKAKVGHGRPMSNRPAPITCGSNRGESCDRTHDHSSESLNRRYARATAKPMGTSLMTASHVATPMAGQHLLGIPPHRMTRGAATQRIATHAMSRKSFSRLNWSGRLTTVSISAGARPIESDRAIECQALMVTINQLPDSRRDRTWRVLSPWHGAAASTACLRECADPDRPRRSIRCRRLALKFCCGCPHCCVDSFLVLGAGSGTGP